MITLITGGPGNGKTCFVIDYILKKAQKENRPVFYAGIPELKTDWLPMENPEKWFDCPEGSIILIDEGQQLFRNRSVGSRVPDHVAKLETHRHKGHDLFILTQHPMLIDNAVRRLAGQHFHLIRQFGLQRSSLYESNTVIEKPEVHSNRKDAIRKTFSYPKKVYDLYKSATQHTYKANVPAKLILLPLSVIGIAIALYVLSGYFSNLNKAKQEQAKATQQTTNQNTGPSSLDKQPEKLSSEEYIKQFQPRITGLPHTAPAYDQVTRIQSAPIPVGCIASKTKCSCYTFQSTVIQSMTEDVCRAYIKHGYFDNTKPRFQVASSEKQSQIK